MQKQTAKATILMAVYNGSPYIAEQLESIQSQTYPYWHLFVRDDCSTDTTVDIIKRFAENDKRITLIASTKNEGVNANFNALLQVAKLRESHYVMLCDQDDYWMPHKIEISIKTLQRIEQNEAGIPLLAYGNLCYVDEALTPLSKTIRVGLPTCPFRKLIFQNWIYGCTMIFNKILLDRVQDIPTIAEHHDYWIALIATGTGKVIHIDDELIFYRQHGKNLSGQYDFNHLTKRIGRIKDKSGKLTALHFNKIQQLKAFFERFEHQLRPIDRQVVRRFLELGNQKRFFFACLYAYRQGIGKLGTLQTLLGYYYWLRACYIHGNRNK